MGTPISPIATRRLPTGTILTGTAVASGRAVGTDVAVAEGPDVYCGESVDCGTAVSPGIAVGCCAAEDPQATATISRTTKAPNKKGLPFIILCVPDPSSAV